MSSLMVGCAASVDATFVVDGHSEVRIGDRAKLHGVTIRATRNSVVDIEDEADIAEVTVTADQSVVHIGPRALIRNAIIDAHEGSRAVFGEGDVLDCPARDPNTITLQAGTMELAPTVRVQGDVLVRFGGILTIGSYTGIGYGTKLRCEERVQIGTHCMISYDTLLFDTNTHSTDWVDRRRIAEASFPRGVHETSRPRTAPVTIGDDVWIGLGATILKGTVLGSRCTVGTRTTVSGICVPEDAIVVSSEPRILSRPCAR
ncbi:MAG: hypothetical protein IT208_14740 [Chthonomonadales bacterium]|nr:hypothetical protein [Chthonomonadales bacterium]